MTNTNCLAGMKCPECGNEESLRIETKITVDVTDDGAEPIDGDYEWDEDSPAHCPECGESGVVADFEVDKTEQATLITTFMPQHWKLESEANAIQAIVELAELDAEEGDSEATSRRVQALAEAARGFTAGRGAA